MYEIHSAQEVLGTNKFALTHPEGTSISSDNCDLLKVSDFNGSL